MELNHFSHDHPLILSDEEYSAFTELNNCLCEICCAPLVGLCYCCHVCTYALHKWCADLPLHTQHELHSDDHTLVLSQNDSSKYKVCEECSKKISGFAFGCTECSFYVHTDCASLPEGLTVSLKEQKELFKILSTVQFDLVFRKKNKLSKKYGNCFVCSHPVAGSMFVCPDFPNIFFHIHCAMLPTTLKHERHVHALELAVNITDLDPNLDPDCDEFYCDNCEQERDVTRGAYFCQECNFVCHISCAIAGLDRPIQRVLETNPIYVKARTLMHHLALTLWKPPEVDIKEEHEKEKIRRDERGKEGDGTKLVHFSHEHPLVLYDEKMNTVYKCDVCATSIFGKTYVCNECTFYLHKWCAKLPQQIINPIRHPNHLLTLTPKHMFNCKYCNRLQNAFSYSCKGCSFEIDVQCASIPKKFKCKGHEHGLEVIMFIDKYEEDPMNENSITVMYSQSPPCKACGYLCKGISIGCVELTCSYNLHVFCSLLPINGKALTHMHDLSLCYSYDEDPNALEFYCDACETERTPGIWVYECEDPKCDIVAHIDCAVSEVPEHIYSIERQIETTQDVIDPPASIIGSSSHTLSIT